MFKSCNLTCGWDKNVLFYVFRTQLRFYKIIHGKFVSYSESFKAFQEESLKLRGWSEYETYFK